MIEMKDFTIYRFSCNNLTSGKITSTAHTFKLQPKIRSINQLVGFIDHQQMDVLVWFFFNFVQTCSSKLGKTDSENARLSGGFIVQTA